MQEGYLNIFQPTSGLAIANKVSRAAKVATTTMQTNGLIFHLHKSYIYNSLTMEDGLLFHYIKVQPQSLDY